MPTEPPLAASLRVPALMAPAGRAPVPRALFGKFTEHLGRNVYGGAWAQIAPNPAFAPASAWPDRVEMLRRLRAASAEFALAGLPAAAEAGGPPWWAVEGDVRAEADASGARPSWMLASAAAAPGRVATPVHLPVHRTRRYLLHVELRGDTPAEVSLRLPGQGAWASARVDAAREWATLEVSLQGAGPAASGTPFHLVVAPARPGRLQLRSCLLFPDDHLDGWDPDVVCFMREARLPLLRFPGGNFVSGYRWRDGIGPRAERPVRPNPAWPEVEWNHVGTDEWLRLCELVGCAALICVNAGDGTPEEAADWVEYCNGAADSPVGALRAHNGHPRPHGVRLWEVGNELYGSWQIGATDAAEYGERYRAFARAMLARDPSIEMIANGDTEAWNRAVVAANPAQVRSLSHHCLYAGFPEDADPRRVYLEHMAFTPAYGRLWHELVRPLREAGTTPRLAITEQQVFTRRPHLPNNATLTEALWTASILNEAIRADGLVELVTHSALVNHGGGLRKEREVVYAQPVWWTTHLYATAPDPLYRLEAEVEGPRFSVAPYRLRVSEDAPYLDAVALADDSGRAMVLFLVNRHPDRAIALTVAAPTGSFREAEIHTLTGESYMAANSRERPDAVVPVVERRPWPDPRAPLVLPPCSLVRVRLS
jgi:alpha-N-arabinofuranosidase